MLLTFYKELYLMSRFSFRSIALSTALLAGGALMPAWHQAQAQETETSVSVAPSTPTTEKSMTIHGHKNSPPPGYTYAPSMEMQNGPDPDHARRVHRDPITGANISRFGSAFTAANPTQQGQLGDATGNGWLAPHGNK